MKLVLICLVMLVSCSKRRHVYYALDEESSNAITETQQKVNELSDRVAVLEAKDKLFEQQIESLYALVELNSIAIVANSAAIDDVVLPLIDELELDLLGMENKLDTFESHLLEVMQDLVDTDDSVEDLEEAFEVALASLSNTFSQEIAVVFDTITSLEETVLQNDIYVAVPGCEHSYFVLYNANSSIRDLYLTEDDGTIGGAWILQNNATYNLLIDSVVVCTGVKYSKVDKKLYYNNGSSEFIDLSY